MTHLTVAELLDANGLDLGASDWRSIRQEDVNQFAVLTGDDQWIHVDALRASAGPFGRPVAHGYLLLSLLPLLMRELFELTDKRLSINYGIDRIRFTAPVTVGSRVRLHATVAEAHSRGDGVLVRTAVELELEGSEKPALVGEVLSLVFAQA